MDYINLKEAWENMDAKTSIDDTNTLSHDDDWDDDCCCCAGGYSK